MNNLTSLAPVKHATPALSAVLCAIILCGVSLNAAAGDGKHSSVASFDELFDISMKEKRGLMFFIDGQSIPGIVTKVNDDGTVEARSQSYGRIVIRIRKIDALAIN